MHKILLLDTETTGNDLSKDRLVEVCYKIGDQKKIACELFKPPLPMSVKSMSVTHLTNKMLEDKQAFEGSSMKAELATLLTDHILVAHNAPFDIAMLKAEDLEISSFIDTLRVARFLDPGAVIPEYNLQYLRYYLDLDVPEAKAHDAKSDVLVLEALFNRLLEKVKETEVENAIQKMVRISAKPSVMKKFTFGKYIGQNIKEIAKTDRGYLEWLYTQKKQNPSTPDEDDWLYTLKHYLE